MTAPRVAPIVKYVTPEGRLTEEGLRLLERLAAMLDDHEARIVTLEP